MKKRSECTCSCHQPGMKMLHITACCEPDGPTRKVVGRDTVTDLMASLAAAISLLENTPQASAAAPSDTMFRTMITDYKASLVRARLSRFVPPTPPVNLFVDVAKGVRMQSPRQPPQSGAYPGTGLSLIALDDYPSQFYPRFDEELVHGGITAEQAREAAHLLNQLAEYLECR